MSGRHCALFWVWLSILPEILEPRRRQLGVAHRVLDVLVPKVGLKRTRIVPLGGKREATGMAQHVRVRLETEVRLSSRTPHHARKPCGSERCPALRRENEGRLGLLLALQPPEPPQLVPEDRMGAGAALLDPADVQRGRGEVDLFPARVRQLGSPEAVPVGHQYHRGVPVGPTVAVAGLQQSFDLGFRRIRGGAGRH